MGVGILITVKKSRRVKSVVFIAKLSATIQFRVRNSSRFKITRVATTQAALSVLMGKEGFSDLLKRAVNAAVKRGGELS